MDTVRTQSTTMPVRTVLYDYSQFRTTVQSMDLFLFHGQAATVPVPVPVLLGLGFASVGAARLRAGVRRPSCVSGSFVLQHYGYLCTLQYLSIYR